MDEDYAPLASLYGPMMYRNPRAEIAAIYREAYRKNAYDGNRSMIPRSERTKRKKKDKIAKSSRKRNRK